MEVMDGFAIRGIAMGTVLLLAAACAAPPPAAVVTLGVDRATVPVGSVVQATLRFGVSPTIESLDEDYRVLVHVLDDQERWLWTADHEPPVPTSEWRPGQLIEYSQRIRVPPYPYAGTAIMAISMESATSGERLVLLGDDLGDFVYRVGSLTLEPRAESSFVVYDEGWHQVEFDMLRGTEWRWSTGRAVLSFRNPHAPIKLLLEVQGRPGLFERPQRLSIVAGERTLREVMLDTRDIVYLDYEFTTAEMGSDDIVQLDFLVDQTFVPADSGNAGDARELGVRLFGAYVEPLPESGD